MKNIYHALGLKYTIYSMAITEICFFRQFHLLLTSHLLPSSQLLITHALLSQVLCQLSSDFLLSVVEALSLANGNTQGCH